MKKYSFRLEAVLKLRRLKEENCRMELGQMMAVVTNIDNQIVHEFNEIKNYYTIQETALSSGTQMRRLQGFPGLIIAKEKNIELLKREKTKQERLIQEKIQDLARLRGELKVIENLKEKDYEAFRKAYNKEMDQKIEEQTQNWMNFNRAGKNQ